jgi:hypothetical protein
MTNSTSHNYPADLHTFFWVPNSNTTSSLVIEIFTLRHCSTSHDRPQLQDDERGHAQPQLIAKTTEYPFVPSDDTEISMAEYSLHALYQSIYEQLSSEQMQPAGDSLADEPVNEIAEAVDRFSFGV